MNIEQLKQKIQASTALADAEKKDWLSLLPRMSPEHILELERIITPMTSSSFPPGTPTVPSGLVSEGIGEVSAIHNNNNTQLAKPLEILPSIPSKVSPLSTAQKMTLEIIGGPARQSPDGSSRMADGEKKPAVEIKPISKPETVVIKPTPPPLVIPKPAEHNLPLPSLASRGGELLLNISTASVEDLRKAPSIYALLEQLKQKIKNHEDALAFEKSPLCQAYLQVGIEKMQGLSSELLTHDEFEAIADFRSSLKRVL